MNRFLSRSKKLVVLKEIWYNSSMQIVFSIGLLLILLITSFLRNSLWGDEGKLWLDTINKSPKKARGYNELGLEAINSKNYTLALDAFTRALKLDPYLSQTYVNIGLVYEGLNQIDEAIAAYERSTRMNPVDPVPYYNMGILYYKSKQDRQKALDLFLKARDLNPLEPDVHNYLSAIYRDMGLHDQANEEMRLFMLLK